MSGAIVLATGLLVLMEPSVASAAAGRGAGMEDGDIDEAGPESAPDTADEDGEEDLEEPVHETLVRLRSRGDLEVRLYELTGDLIAKDGPSGERTAVTYKSICAAPCKRRLDLSEGRSFFVGSDEVTRSERFRLDRYAGVDEVLISVRPGPRKASALGKTLFWTAGALAVGGAALAFFASLETTSPVTELSLAVTGLVLVVSSIPCLVGAVVARNKGRTRVSVEAR